MRSGFLNRMCSASTVARELVWVEGSGALAYAIGEIVGTADGDQCKIRLCAESSKGGVRTLKRSQCHPLEVDRPGERLLAFGCLREGTLTRLLASLSWAVTLNPKPSPTVMVYEP